jgi:hypothetical protein
MAFIRAGNVCMEFRSCPKRFQNNYVPLYFFPSLEKRGLSKFFFPAGFFVSKAEPHGNETTHDNTFVPYS